MNNSGDTSSGEDDADFYGTNSAVLTRGDASLDISNVEIFTDSKGSNGIFVTNSAGSDNIRGMPHDMSGEDSSSDGNSHANVKDVKITTYRDKSRGLDATYGGVITAENVEINTNGQSCAAVATDRGEGIINISDSVLNTGVDQKSGRGSPIIYSTGDITLENTKGEAYVSQIACIEGKNSIVLDSCDLACFGEGNREDNGKYVDLGGVFIYQSMSGDADVGTATFNATDSQLGIDSNSSYYETAPMFHITNTKSVINLDECEFDFGSGVFLEASGQNQWGNEGSNGGDVELNLNDMEVDGNITVDEISSLSFKLTDSHYNGAINSTGNTSVSIAEGSTWSLTGDSYVTGLENNGEIEYGQYTLYVNGKAYNDSNKY